MHESQSKYLHQQARPVEPQERGLMAPLTGGHLPDRAPSGRLDRTLKTLNGLISDLESIEMNARELADRLIGSEPVNHTQPKQSPAQDCNFAASLEERVEALSQVAGRLNYALTRLHTL